MVAPSLDFGNWGGTLVLGATALAVVGYFTLTNVGFAALVLMLAVAVVVLYYVGVALDNWLRHGGPL